MCSRTTPHFHLLWATDLCTDFRNMRAARYRKGHATGTWFDNGSSIFIFMGYAVPGYVLGALLVVFLAARWEWFPTGGFVGVHYESTPVQSVSVQAGSYRWSAPDHSFGMEMRFGLNRASAAIPKLENQAGYWAEVLDADHFRYIPQRAHQQSNYRPPQRTSCATLHYGQR